MYEINNHNAFSFIDNLTRVFNPQLNQFSRSILKKKNCHGHFELWKNVSIKAFKNYLICIRILYKIDFIIFI